MKKFISLIFIYFIAFAAFSSDYIFADALPFSNNPVLGPIDNSAAQTINKVAEDGGGSVGNPDSPSNPSNGNASVGKLSSATGKIWSTFAIVAQMLAITAIIFTGLRYMLTNADDRADIKMQTILLVIGASLVFAAVPFANFIIGIVNQTIK